MKAQLFSFRNLLIALLAAMIATSLYLFNQKDEADKKMQQAKPKRKAALTVTTIQPKSVEWPVTVKLQGTVYPWQEAVVSSEISGLRITKVYADVGQSIKRGQMLVQLADETIVTAINKQKATVAREKAALLEAQTNANRAREIKDTGALSSQMVNQYLIAEKTAEANLAVAEAELNNQQIRLSQTKILAPDSGMISSRDAKLGTVVNAGTPLFSLIRKHRIEWRAEANANMLKTIAKNQSVKVNTANGKQTTGKVRLVAPTVDSLSRKGLVYIDIPADSSKPGMYLTGEVNTGQQSALTLPESAITMRDGNAYVFEIINDTTQADQYSVKQTKVSLGRQQADSLEVNGLNVSSQYVETGGAFLNDGDIVQIASTEAAE